MKNWSPIEYREFYDLPRIFLVRAGAGTYLFDCSFDVDTDEYSKNYKVFLMLPLAGEDLVGSWANLASRAEKFLGEIHVSEVEFDPTRRAAVNIDILRNLLAGNH